MYVRHLRQNVIDSPVDSELKERKVHPSRNPDPEKTPTEWDGEKRQTVAIIVIDAVKNRSVYDPKPFSAQISND
jgi:hypothetical protein